MSDPITSKATIEVTVAGATFKLRRRSTFLMAEAQGIKAAIGLIGGENAVATGKLKADTVDRGYGDLIEAVLRAAMVEPRVSEPGEPSVPPKCYSFEDLKPFADALFSAVMESGLEVSPSPSSCEDLTEQNSQERSTS